MSDINEELILAYRLLRRMPYALRNLVTSWPITPSHYYSVRACNPGELPALHRAARFLYLNRHAFNGVYRTNLSGHFNVPMGTKTGTLPSKEAFAACSAALRRCELLHADFEQVLDTTGDGDFIYLDPPYRPPAVRNRGEYGPGAFNAADLQRLIGSVTRASNRGAKIMISYYHPSDLADYLPTWNATILSAHRHVSGFASHRSHAGELILCNYQERDRH